jgi:Glycosyl hydrolases family 2, sugar binding domain/Glycosyl hydrolases family 2/Glycosyl hydrolases family 2, TIM barrel domain
MMIRSYLLRFASSVLLLGGYVAAQESKIPRPEHPRPDAMRANWANLNGRWEFRFDAQEQGLAEGWEKPGTAGYNQTIVVPFPWESELSGIHQVKGAPKVAWYRRRFKVPAVFPTGNHVWLRFGAVDWRADVWINGKKVAEHEGGYTPFEADITDALNRAGENVVVVRAHDPTDPALPTGKQVGWYTPSSGIWQTVWLEARPTTFISDFRIVTKIDPATVHVKAFVTSSDRSMHSLVFKSDDPTVNKASSPGIAPADATGKATFIIELETTVKDAKLWTPETPQLYDATLELKDEAGKVIDSVATYFGLRTISRGRYGDLPYERILLNGKPIYLRAALDQSFNPKGLYTAPDDDFFKRDMIIAKAMGLNGLRIHIKPDEPRRLYWADHFGILILEDMPNTWRQNAVARRAWEQTMRDVVARDRNHPSIITWVAFNETWGLGKPEDYKKDKDTQAWVASMVRLMRELDGHERLVEDNSPCNYDHIAENDLNSWHFYIDNHEKARSHIEEVVNQTKPGSGFNYCPGLAQTNLPLINSEYGAVSAGGGDRDISWGLRDLTTQLRRQPKIQGFVYTELSDIEWEHNGLVNYDRTPKVFAYDAWLPDMRPNELMGADFIGYDAPPAIVGKPGETISLPIFVSHFSQRPHKVMVRWWVSGHDSRADIRTVVEPRSFPITWRSYDVVNLEPLKITLPDYPFVGAINLTLRDEQNQRFAANFVNLVVKPDHPLPRIKRRNDHDVTIRFAPGDFARQEWSERAQPPPGKVYGRGKGYFEYRIELPPAVVKAHPESFYYLFQAGSKAKRQRVDWPERESRQDYPQTDQGRTWSSTLAILLNGRPVDRITLPDDAADARGVLSHLAGVEHGSHGELVDGMIVFSDRDRAIMAAGGPMVLRLAVPDDAPDRGGLCIFGATTGEMPLDPTIEVHTRDTLPADLAVDPDRSLAVPAGP